MDGVTVRLANPWIALEDSQVKLSTVVSDIFGMSGRAMLEAMIGEQRYTWALAQLAHGRMRCKLSRLEEASPAIRQPGIRRGVEPRSWP
jgi:hypothetical protein